MHFIGIDIGTSSVSGIIYNDKDNKIESVTVTNDAHIPADRHWEKIQCPERILELVQQVLDDFLVRYPSVNGIGITGQMHGMLYTDKAGLPLSPLYSWQDARGNELYKEGKTYSAFLSEKTGYPLATGYGLVTHFYNQENQLVPENTSRICTIMDYVVMKLVGGHEPLTDYSNGASLGFFDTEHLSFDKEALTKVNIDTSIVPALDDSAICSGKYDNRIPVYSAIGDNQAAFLGSVRNIERTVHITIGTSSQLSVYSPEFVKVPSLDTRPFPGGGYLLVGAALCGGQAFALLKNFFEQTVRAFTGKVPDPADMYKVMTSFAYPAEPANLPVVETLFDGTRYEPWKRGKIENISRHNFTPEALTLGFLQGISRELYDFYRLLPEEIRNGKDCMVGSGNAIKKNKLLSRALEDQFDMKLHFSSSREEAALGAAICAMKGERH
ncbi:MAG: hypothetical protein LUG98_02940 [Tannerellaceae bacterium]|nr:hypothetical protein [Tannerellaceae bacterium]